MCLTSRAPVWRCAPRPGVSARLYAAPARQKIATQYHGWDSKARILPTHVKTAF